MRPGVENFPVAYDRPPPLEHRLAVLPDILSKSLDATLEWSPLVPDGN